MRRHLLPLSVALATFACGDSNTQDRDTASADTTVTGDTSPEVTPDTVENDTTPDVAPDATPDTAPGDSIEPPDSTDTSDDTVPDAAPADTGTDTVDPNACTEDSDCLPLFIVPPNACLEPRCIDQTCQLGPRLCGDSDPCTLDACDPRMGCLNVLMTVDVGPSQFLLCQTPMTQAEAQTACTDRGLELASIDSEADATAVATLLADSGFDSAFIGAASTWLCPGKRILPQVCRALPLDTCPIDESCATTIPFVCETHCNDGDPCTRDFVGPDGLCQSAEGGCDDGDPCTTDVCDPRDGCLHTPITGCPADP